MPKTLATIIFLIYIFGVALIFGGYIGWGFGKMMGRLRHETRQTFIPDIVLGWLGFIAGTWFALKDFSLYQESYNGIVTVRRVTGYGDYFLMIAPLGAIVLVFAFQLALATNNVFCRSRKSPAGI
jgi:uncharacterized membrane protein YeaQ/YmgE (transglycosylase-associated protein family)